MTSRQNGIAMAAVFGGLILLGIALRLFMPDTEAASSDATIAAGAAANEAVQKAEDRRHPEHLEMADGCFGAANLDALDHAIRLINDHDMAAVADLIVNDPALFMVPKGTRLISVDFSIMHAAEKVRPVGRAAEFWTPKVCVEHVSDDTLR